MEKESINSTYQCPLTLDELVDDMEKHIDKYKHLQFILNRQKHINLGLGQKYLVVNYAGFDLYELINLDCSNGIIQLTFTNPDNGNSLEINLDINNEHPNIFLVNWKDLEEMVLAERKFDCSKDECLNLGYENHE